jgi:hypothetical protein
MFERGAENVISEQTVELICSKLGIDLAVLRSAVPSVLPPAGSARYCPNQDCYSNLPYVQGGEVYFLPDVLPGTGDERCRWCGEVLARCCPNADCSMPVSAGTCCGRCGTAYVEPAPVTPDRGEAWADSRREKIMRLREMKARAAAAGSDA